MSEHDKTFSLMDVAIFDITSVTVAVVTGCCTFIVEAEIVLLLGDESIDI